MNPPGFFSLSSVRDKRSNVAWPRLGAHRSGGGKARRQRLHSGSLVPGRCQARPCFHAPRKGKNGPQLALGVLENKNTCLFRDVFPGNVPTRMEAFPTLSFVRRSLPKAVQWLPVPSPVEIAHTLVKRGTVFTRGPAPLNPYVIQFSRYYSFILSGRGKSGNTGLKLQIRLTPWDTSAGAYAGLKPSPSSE
jgi:hypothetical protein